MLEIEYDDIQRGDYIRSIQGHDRDPDVVITTEGRVHQKVSIGVSSSYWLTKRGVMMSHSWWDDVRYMLVSREDDER